MSENRISIQISAPDLATINTAAKTIRDTLAPYVIALAPEDKQAVPKVKDKSVPFMLKGLQYMQTNPEFISVYADTAEINKDYTAFDVMKQLLQVLSPIVSNIEDTGFLCGSEAYQGILNYYNNVKQAVKMNVPDAQAIYDDMKVYFEAQKAKPLPPTT
jgi:hypothetical protein